MLFELWSDSHSAPILFNFVVLLPWVILVAFVARSAFRSISRRARPNTHIAQREDFAKMSFVLSLCERTYAAPGLLQNNAILWDHTMVRVARSGVIWIWQRNSTPPEQRQWIIAIKGTSNIRDLFQDGRLLLDTARPGRFNKWQRDAFALRRQVEELLTELGVNLDEDKVTFIGHSLGASHAEYLLHFFRQRSRTQTNLYGFTIDSPGQPPSFRIETGMQGPLPNLTTLNAPPNLFNTLNVPVAQTLYCCGDGPDVHLNIVWNVISTSYNFSADVAWFALKAFGRYSANHYLKSIKDYLDDCDISETTAAQWPTYTNTVVAYIPILPSATAFQPLAPGPGPGPRPPRPRPPPPPTAAPHRPPVARRPQEDDHPGLERLPGARNEMVTGVPYKCSGDGDVTRFQSMLVGSDKVLALIADSLQGKSSIFKVFVGLLFSDRRIRVSRRANTTRWPIVAKIGEFVVDAENGKRRTVFLVDIPGLGGQGMLSQPNGWAENDARVLLDKLRSWIGVIYYIRRTPFLDDAATRLRQIQNICGDEIDIRYIHNYDGFSDRPQEHEEHRADFVNALPPNTPIIQCTVVRDPDSTKEERDRHDDVALLREWRSEISPEALRSNAGTFADRQRRSAPQDAQRDAQQAGHAHDAAVRRGAWSTTFTGVLTYLPGAPWWSPYLGPSLTTSIGVIGAVAVAISVGVGAGAYYVACYQHTICGALPQPERIVSESLSLFLVASYAVPRALSHATISCR
ncbi:hypothetical protein IE81DRAFT_325599 [Ceraceosorus guamensis]|uniref:Uncharacterized protein n=1 Tax=Ceraceosorus guamensis TaxID=1522189 RepID=A0A316VSF2_9BASI|nr:hypothetical protein IE81DRAFT_325599 [Ceraceosorus guamensis]PWN40432.1 hypothetical protein IE81DRAFT_325599 [Ceraceosorus guamensis]